MTPTTSIQFCPLVSRSENSLEYRSTGEGRRAYIKAIWMFGLPALVPPVVVHFLLSAPLGIPSYLVTAIVFPLAIAVGALIAEARQRSQKGFNAIETLVAANDAIIAAISAHDHEKQRILCYDLYTLLLRSIYCVAVSKPFQVTFPDKPASPHYEQLLIGFQLALKEAKLDSVIAGSNGRLHQVLQARSAIKMIVTVRISKSMYVAVGVLFALSYATIVLATARELHVLIAAAFAAAFAYGIGTLIYNSS